MTIEEARHSKEQLEALISVALEQYDRETNCRVTGIKVTGYHMDQRIPLGKGRNIKAEPCYDVTVEVML